MNTAFPFRFMTRLARSGPVTAGMCICSLVLWSSTALADVDDEEMAAIRSQIRSLEAKFAAMEKRRSSRAHASTPNEAATTPRTLRGSYPLHPHAGSTGMPVTEEPAASDIRIGSASADAPFFRYLGPDAAAQGAPHGSSVDLSSSSPLAITQTSVDRLPPVFSIGNISVRIGGFLELSNIWRDSNMTSGPATAWNNFPYANSPNHGLSEERLSAQLSRFSTLLEANPTSSVRLQAYVESDFGGSGGSTNSVQINGYVPRLRQGYFTFTQKAWGFHLLMGQAWSLTTGYAKGVLPRNEQLPAVTDNNQIPGITFTRVPQIRIGKDWGQKYWLALSIEDPQATVSSATASGGTLPATGDETVGPRVYYENAGGVLLNPDTQYTDNPVPDIVLKGAVDTSVGHYEVFGLARWFRSVVETPGSTHTHQATRFGGGVGGGMTVPLATPKLQLTGNVLAGEGIGRYGPSLLPDTTFNSRGELAPVPEMHGALGLIGHPDSSVLLYLYGGVETAGRRRYTAADGSQVGYGITDQNLGGCDVEFGTCNAQTRTLASLTAGGWWHFLDGQYGSVMGGVQYTYIRKLAFRGNDGMGNSVYPTTSGNTVYVTFRYLPFQ
ncbi:hypothetical protein ACU81Q_03025 [Komagataeibacter melomenusus]